MTHSDDEIVLVSLVSSLHDPRLVEEVTGKFRNSLKGYFDREVLPSESKSDLNRLDAPSVAGVIALVVTGGTERRIQSVAELGKPLLVLTHESMNSLPAALEALPSIANPPPLLLGSERAELRKVKGFVKAARALARIRRHRLGLIGGPSPWLIYSRPNRRKLFDHLGIKLINIPMKAFDKGYATTDIHEAARKFSKKAQTPISQAKSQDFAKATAVYLTLKKIIESRRLSALSLKCFDLITDHKVSGCYAISRLNDEGFVAGCEGDVPSAAAMIVLSEVSEYPTFMANASYVKGRTLILAHCTIATRLTEKFRYRTHFESGIGVALVGTLKKGRRVTVARFNSAFDVLRVGQGIVVRGNAWSEQLCRTQVELKMDGDVEIIKNRSFGNHYALAYGEHAATLRGLASLIGIKYEEM